MAVLVCVCMLCDHSRAAAIFRGTGGRVSSCFCRDIAVWTYSFKPLSTVKLAFLCCGSGCQVMRRQDMKVCVYVAPVGRTSVERGALVPCAPL